MTWYNVGDLRCVIRERLFIGAAPGRPGAVTFDIT